MIDTATDTLVGLSIAVGAYPQSVVVTPDGSKVYVANYGSASVSVIDTASDIVIGSIEVGSYPDGLAVTPDGSRVYVANQLGNSVSVIATATNTVIGSPIAVGRAPFGVAVASDGRRAYVANYYSNTVSVIDTATNVVVGPRIPVGVSPAAFGQFIQSKPKFAGKPGQKNRIGQSTSALARRYGGLRAAVRALHYASVPALRAAMKSYCKG